MKAFIAGFLVVLLLGLGYLFVHSDLALLGDESCLKIASTDVLGNALYGKSCPRSSYQKDVEIQHSQDKAGAVLFKFHPSASFEVQCPTIIIIVDRKTGEAWIG